MQDMLKNAGDPRPQDQGPNYRVERMVYPSFRQTRTAREMKSIDFCGADAVSWNIVCIPSKTQLVSRLSLLFALRGQNIVAQGQRSGEAAERHPGVTLRPFDKALATIA